VTYVSNAAARLGSGARVSASRRRFRSRETDEMLTRNSRAIYGCDHRESSTAAATRSRRSIE